MSTFTIFFCALLKPNMDTLQRRGFGNSKHREGSY